MHAAGHGKKPADPVPAGSPANTPLGPFDTAAREALIVDFTTDATMLEKNADTPMVPSSMTKLMTAYFVYDALQRRQAATDAGPSGQRTGLEDGRIEDVVPYPGSVKVEDLIRGMIVQSGNDACVVLAEAIAGSEEAFVQQ